MSLSDIVEETFGPCTKKSEKSGDDTVMINLLVKDFGKEMQEAKVLEEELAEGLRDDDG